MPRGSRRTQTSGGPAAPRWRNPVAGGRSLAIPDNARGWPLVSFLLPFLVWMHPKIRRDRALLRPELARLGAPTLNRYDCNPILARQSRRRNGLPRNSGGNVRRRRSGAAPCSEKEGVMGQWNVRSKASRNVRTIMELPHVDHLGDSRFRILRVIGLPCRFICAKRRLGDNEKCANHDRSQRGAEMLPR